MDETKIFPIKGLVFNTIKGNIVPRFLCQYCNEMIMDAPAANIVWGTEETEALVVHKKCYAQTIQEGRPHLSTMSLDVELAYLLWNTGMTDEVLTKARATADSRSAI